MAKRRPGDALDAVATDGLFEGFPQQQAPAGKIPRGLDAGQAKRDRWSTYRRVRRRDRAALNPAPRTPKPGITAPLTRCSQPGDSGYLTSCAAAWSASAIGQAASATITPKRTASRRYSRFASASMKPWLRAQSLGIRSDPSSLPRRLAEPPRRTGPEDWKLQSVAGALLLLNRVARGSLTRPERLTWNVGFMSVWAQLSSAVPSNAAAVKPSASYI